MRDELLKFKKLKKEKEARDYINPELAEKHNEQGTALYKEGISPLTQASSHKLSRSTKRPLSATPNVLNSTEMWARFT